MRWTTDGSGGVLAAIAAFVLGAALTVDAGSPLGLAAAVAVAGLSAGSTAALGAALLAGLARLAAGVPPAELALEVVCFAAIGIAIEEIERTRARLVALAERDPLTGLLHRRGLERALGELAG